MVASDLEMRGSHPSVVHMLARAAVVRPTAPAVIYRGTTVSYRELWASVLHTAHRLGGRDGQRVAVAMGNSLETLIVYFAVMKSGAQLVLLNPNYTPTELRSIIVDAAPTLVVHNDDAKPAVAEALAGIATSYALGAGEIVVMSGAVPPSVDGVLDVDPDSLALLQYTGGTSGTPKGVNLSHRSLACNVAQREALLPTQFDCERVLCVMPVFHSYALCMGILLAFNSRGTLVLLDRYRPNDVFRAVREHGVTVFPGNPTIFVGLLQHSDFNVSDWATVHTCYSGSAPLPEEVLIKWENMVEAPIYEGYGQTEAGSILTFNPYGGERKPGSVGVPVAGTEVEVVDLESGRKVLGPCELGEVRARGPQVMRGYRNRPDETSATLRDGWLYTGDIGYLDQDGYLFIRDRKKELCIVGGYNVYPREVEEVLFNHPSVIDAAVVSASDSYRGEVLHAFITVRGDEASEICPELREFCSRHLAKYKVPAEFHIVGELPKTPVNKTDKIALRAKLSTQREAGKSGV